MKNKGFTLIELMIVVAIIGIVVSIVGPLLSGSMAQEPKHVMCFSGEAVMYDGMATNITMYSTKWEFTDTKTGSPISISGNCVAG